jgi:hypothetical protein
VHDLANTLRILGQAIGWGTLIVFGTSTMVALGFALVHVMNFWSSPGAPWRLKAWRGGSPDDVKDVLAVIGLYEDGDEDCNNALLDHETGLDPAAVDEVLNFLWQSDQIEGILTLGGRNPSLDDIRRVVPDRPRL